MRANIYFSEDYDADKIDELCENYNADLWYRERKVRFKGTSERLEAFLAEICKISQPIKIIRY